MRAGLLAWWVAAAAQAQGGADAVWVDASACPGLAGESVRGLAALELAPRPVVLHATQAAPPPDATTARLVCAAGVVQMSVREPGHARLLSLELDLTRTPAAAQPRLIALTLSELVVSSRMESSLRAERAPSPPAEPEPEPEPQRAEQRLSLWLAAGLARHGQPAALAPALHAGVLADLGPVGLWAEAQGDLGGEQLPAGDVRVVTLSAAVAPALRARLARFDLFAGAGLRGGFARLGGSSSDPALEGRSLHGAWLAPMLAFGVQLRLSTPLALHGGLELGYVVKPVRGFDAAQQELYALEGARMTLALGLALRP